MTLPLLLQSSEPALTNASASVTGGFASSTSLVPPLLVVLWAVVIVGLLSAARNSDHFERLLDAFGVVALSAYYAIHGLAAVTALAVFSAPVYFLATADASTQSAVGKYGLYAIGGYVGLTAVGYVVKHRLVTPILENADEHDLLPEQESGEGGETA
jgi:hypothetical protein